jgi:hypothetical protein
MISPEPIAVNKIAPIREARIPTKVYPTKVARAAHNPCHSDARAKRDTRNLLFGQELISRGQYDLGDSLVANYTHAATGEQRPRVRWTLRVHMGTSQKLSH